MEVTAEVWEVTDGAVTQLKYDGKVWELYTTKRTRVIPSMPTEKTCSTCHQVKPISEFHINMSAADGHQFACKECRSEFSKQRNLEKKRARETRAEQESVGQENAESKSDGRKISDGSIPLTSSGVKDKKSVKDNWGLFKRHSP